MTVRPVPVAASVAATILMLHLPPVAHRGVLIALVPSMLILAGFAVAPRRLSVGAWQLPRVPWSGGTVLLVGVLPALALLSALRWQERLLPAACERQSVRLEGTLRDLPRHYRQRGETLYRIDLEGVTLQPARCAGPRRVRLYLAQADARSPRGSPGTPEDPVPDALHAASSGAGSGSSAGPGPRAAFAPGDRLALDARLRPPWGAVNPGVPTGARHYYLDGIHAVGSADLLRVEGRSGAHIPLRARIDRVRIALSAWVRRHASPVSAALLAALAVGDQRFLSAADWERLRAFGLTHLLVISGLHVSLLALPGWLFGVGLSRLPGAGRAIARCLPPVCALVPAAFYALLAGFSLPTQRALLMLVLASLPRLAGRRVSAPNLLALVVLLLLLMDPASVLGASLWLSLGAVALLLWYVSCRDRQRGLRAFAGAQLFMLTAMIPIGLLIFGSSSGPGGLANLVAIPLIAFLVVPALLLSLLLLVLWEPGAIATLAVPSFLMETLWSAMDFWEPRLPAWSPGAYPGSAALLLCLLAVVSLALPRVPARWALVVFLLAPLLLAAGFASPGAVSVVVFDVGQGTAVLVRDGDAALLYDTGPGPPDGPPLAARTVLPALARLGVATLEMLVVSHPDRDHAAGESVVRARLAPARIRRGRGADGQRCRLGGRERLGRFVTLQSLSVSRPGDSDNNASCVLMVEVRGRRFLLPGDIDERRERALVAYWRQALRADVLLASHHGSGSGSSHLFLRSVDPRFLVVSAAPANRFGHPAAAVLERAAKRDIAVLNTASSGAIEFRVDATGALDCRRYRHALAPFWRWGEGRRDCGGGWPEDAAR